MAETTVKLIEKKEEWESFLKNHPESNFLQSWYWGEFHKNLGKTIFRMGFFQDKKLIGVMLCVIEDARRGRYMTVPGGPIIDWENRKLVKEIFNKMKQIAIDSKCIFVRVRPQLKSSNLSKKIFSDNGLKGAPMYLHGELTSVLDITKSEEELLSSMRKSTRYEIRKADKLGIEIIREQDINSAKEFYDYQIETAKRQKFVPFSYKYFFEQFRVFFNADKAIMYTAKYENKILAQAFVIFYGKEAVYHYGVGTMEGRKYPGAYLIQWEAILDAKKRGLMRYNFWGVASEEDKNHRFYTISIFKRGFGGEDTEYLHAQDLVIDKPRYLINSVIENIRKRIRRV